MADELHNPTDYMKAKGGLKSGFGMLLVKVVAVSGADQAESREDESSEGFKQQVQRGIKKRSNSAKVELQIGDSEPLGGGN